MNRLAARIDETRVKCDALSPVDAIDLERTLALSPQEAFAFQNAQARAHVEGILSTDEAMVIYASIGESAMGWKAGTDLATKVVVTLAVSELLQKQVAERRAS